jgi:hypothetical protein
MSSVTVWTEWCDACTLQLVQLSSESLIVDAWEGVPGLGTSRSCLQSPWSGLWAVGAAWRRQRDFQWVQTTE